MTEGQGDVRWNGDGLITLPRWLWAVMGTCILWAGYVTIQLTTLSAQVTGIAASVDGNRAVIEVIQQAEGDRAVIEYRLRQVEKRVETLENHE